MSGFLKKTAALFGGAFRRGTADTAVAAGPAAGERKESGFLVFDHTGDVISAESVLKAGGLSCEIKGPPPGLRSGCDMVIVFELVLEPAVRRLLDGAGIVPQKLVPVQESLLEPVSLFQTKDFGDWLMVRAANMKITVEKASGVIVNVSGGGCPDVPWLAARLTGQSIFEAEEPRLRGRTLCSYSLQKAFEEARRLCRG